MIKKIGLILALVGVLGMVAFKLVRQRDDGNIMEIKSDPSPKFESNVVLIPELCLEYQDPFLIKHSSPKKKTHSKKIKSSTRIEKDKVVVWPAIVVKGFIGDPLELGTIAIVSIDNREYLAVAGEMVAELKLEEFSESGVLINNKGNEAWFYIP